MTEKIEKIEKKQDKKQDRDRKAKKPEKQEKKQESYENVDILLRISGYDIPGNKNVYSGLTRIKGISWAISNAVCLKLGMARTKKISELTKDDVAKIESLLENFDIYPFMKNRRSDPVTGESTHKFGTDLDITRDFDIKRLKKMKSWVGLRHMAGQPVRGQRTRSHFRARDRTSGIKVKRRVSVVAPGSKK